VTTLFESGLGGTSSAGSRVAVFDTRGVVAYTDECGPGVSADLCEADPGAHLVSTTSSATPALAEGRLALCGTSQPPAAECPAGYEGVEQIGGTLPAFDAAVAVRDAAHHFVGVVVYSTTLQSQFARFGAALLYTPSVLTAGVAPTLYRFDPAKSYALATTAADPMLTAALIHRPPSFQAEYPGGSAGPRRCHRS
jgi:hypothetical protein